MLGSAVSSARRTLEMTLTSPCRRSNGWGQSWCLSELFCGPGSIAHSDGTSYFGGRPYPYDARSPHDARGPHPRSPPMRVLTGIGLLLAGGIGSLTAQHRGQVEMGAFGSYTRYDSGFQLDNQFGSGGRLGFFLGDHFSLEVDGNVAQPLSKVRSEERRVG